MNLPKSFNTFTSIIWYGERKHNNAALVDALISSGYQVEQISNEDELKSRFLKVPTTFLILDQPNDMVRCIQLVISFKLQAKDSAFTTILISDKASIEDKEKYYRAGGNEIMHPPVSHKELLSKIKHYKMLCDTANRFAQSIATEENLGKAEESRRRFLTTLSHELRTPLNGILGFSKALKKKDEETPLGKSGIDALSRIFESTNQINAIITTLIDISSASLGAQGMISKNFDISSLALKLETNFRQAALEKGLDFSIDYPDGLTMLSDEKKIYSMLQHLVDNAIKFTQSGSVNIRLNTDFNPTSGQRIIFEVSDTGIGIDPRDHKRIFTEVGQLNNEHNREHYGVGLGLYYVNLLSQQIGGSIEVESTPGEGAKFTLDLPAGELILEAEPVNEEQEIDDLLF